ncbi:MAG: hypothetical protein IPP47_15580 [Bryobacterales bacterium]|nr:hypothetical protein [Bryobacterales bacterium]
MRAAGSVVGIALLTGFAVAATPEKSAVLSLPIAAEAGTEAWPLLPQHLEVTCDGKAIPSTALRREDGAVSVGIVLQPTRYMLQHVPEVQAALRAFLTQIRPGDEVFTVNSLERPALGVGFTSDPGAVVSSVSLPETKRRAHLYDGIDFALRYLENARNPNRALLVIFSNDDVASDIPAKTVKAKILSAHIPTYVVSLYSRTPDDFAPTQYELTRVAIDSGGDIWEVQRFNKLPRVMAGVRVRPDYVLDLNPAQQCGSAEVHALDLRWRPGVAHRGVNLRYQHKLPVLPQ